MSFLHGYAGRLLSCVGVALATRLAMALGSFSSSYTSHSKGRLRALPLYRLLLTDNSTGQDTTMYLYVSEIFPLEIRGIGMGKPIPSQQNPPFFIQY